MKKCGKYKEIKGSKESGVESSPSDSDCRKRGPEKEKKERREKKSKEKYGMRKRIRSFKR